MPAPQGFKVAVSNNRGYSGELEAELQLKDIREVSGRHTISYLKLSDNIFNHYSLYQIFKGNLVFLEEVESLQAEVTKLLGQGVNKIIALGHAGYSKDQEVARRVSGVDVVVGGHTNTFLYTGKINRSDP